MLLGQQGRVALVNDADRAGDGAVGISTAHSRLHAVLLGITARTEVVARRVVVPGSHGESGAVALTVTVQVGAKSDAKGRTGTKSDRFAGARACRVFIIGDSGRFCACLQ